MKTLFGMPLHEVSIISASDQIVRWAGGSESRYVCVANVHSMMEALDSASFFEVLKDADMLVPDGMPLVWMMRIKGARGQTRVYGPDLMLQMLQAAAGEGIPVGLYGSTPSVLDSLAEYILHAYPGLTLAFRESPPFGDSAALDDPETRARIRRTGVRLLFVGLGCPKQERWMATQRGEIPAVMIGVGAAFDFIAGAKPQAPDWMRDVGLEWLFRLLHEPRRLWRRYLYHNPRFLMLAAAEMLGLRKP